MSPRKRNNPKPAFLRVWGLVLCMPPLYNHANNQLALFRANTKNAVVLETYLREKGAKALQAQGHHSPVLDPTDPDVFDSQMSNEDPPPHYATQQPTRQGTQRNGEHRTQTSRVPEEPSRGGWFGSKKQRVADPERGQDLRRNENTDPRRNPSTLQKNRP